MSRIKGIDGIKGLAILGVILYHLFPQQVSGGFLFVNSFLVISGYFFANKMESLVTHEGRSAYSVAQYALKTIERLFVPLFWMVLLIVVGWLYINPTYLHYYRTDIFSSLFFVNNIAQILAGQSYFVQMANASPFTHLWYNSLYLQSFLISVPIIYITIKLKLSKEYKAILWLLLCYLSNMLIGFLYVPGADPSRIYYGTDTRFSAFAAGIALAYVVPILKRWLEKTQHRLFFTEMFSLTTLLCMLYMSIHVNDQSFSTYIIWLPLFSMLTFILVGMLVCGAGLADRILSVPIITYLGKRSYSYYLWYYPVIVFYLSQYRRFGENIWLINGLTLLSLFILGELFYRLIEQKGLIIWFGQSFDFKKDYQALKSAIQLKEYLKTPMLTFLVYISLLTSFIVGLSQTKNNLSPALFELEYQEYQTKPNLLNTPYPGSELAVKVNNQLKELDAICDTYFARRLKLPRLEEVAQKNIGKPLDLGGDKVELLKKHPELQEVEAYMPITFQELNSEELEFALNVPVTFFGDSLIKLTGEVASQLFQHSNMYGQVSLQIWEANDIAQQMVYDGEMQENVVINLGTNASLDYEAMDELVDILGERQIFFVNTNSRVQHKAEVNKIIKDTAAKYPNVHVIDWYSYQQGHPDWYAEDEIHHSGIGMQQFSVITTQTMYRILELGNVD